ncbi:MAG: hypothetical protein KGR18_09985 [Acidobacteria bacterium]|nr:hypothetical protein [Acidobacteriota bacterium]
MPLRPSVVARLVPAGALVAVAMLATGCGSSSSSSSGSSTTIAAPTTTSAGPVISGVVAPVVLDATTTAATVEVGRFVEFSLGDPGEGTFVAVSSDARVFRVDGEGRTTGSSARNAGGVAVGVGSAEVTVSFEGSMNGVGAPTVFTITVTR